MSRRISNFSKTAFFIVVLFFTVFPSGPVSVTTDSSFSEGMVVSADSLATKVGVEILREGGNAVDAAVAVGFALAVTYPVAGNIGGGGFMVIRSADGKETTFDYREKAPALANRTMYLDKDGNFIDSLAQEGILSAGVPGSVSGLLDALEKYGTMSREKVITPALKLARDGFHLPVSTAASFHKYNRSFNKHPSTARIFTDHGVPVPPGVLFKQPDLAATLERIISEGKDGFYKGKTAELIVTQMKAEHGLVTNEDLANYQSVERAPVTGIYRGYKVISMAPPSSGGVALIQLLNILENCNLVKMGHNSPEYVHYLTEAMRRVYADRSEYLGDPDFFNVPTGKLLSKKYAATLFEQIGKNATPSTGVKPGLKSFSESLETTHYSVLDREGNAVSVTTTINSGYGSKVVVEGAGFFLNNEMDDFSAKPGVPNQFGLLGSEANSIQPGKRMLSSMTPTIILKDNKPFLIVGSPGGSTIITSVLQVILNTIDFGMDVRNAVDKPRIHHQWFPDQISVESGVLSGEGLKQLELMGHSLKEIPYLGLIEAIRIDPATQKVTGASDKRGFGMAKGDGNK